MSHIPEMKCEGCKRYLSGTVLTLEKVDMDFKEEMVRYHVRCFFRRFSLT